MRIGSIEIAGPFCQAGLAGYSDRAMRLVARRRGCPYAVTESLLDVIMLNGGHGLKKSIDINDEDHPIAGQIIGSEPEQMARAGAILHKFGYDAVDLNFACPVKKIKNKARGGHMLKDVPRALAIMKAVRDALPPSAITSVSLRRGFDDTSESVEQFQQIAQAAWDLGYSAIRVHGRSVEQKYLGRSRWDFLRQVRAWYPDKTILGSGDVFTAQDAVRMLRETGVDIAWIARGAIGNPWIFQHAAALLKSNWQDGDPLPPEVRPPTIHEQRDTLREHFALAMEVHGEQLAGRRMRKLGIKYARFHPAAQQVKDDFIAVLSLRDWTRVLDKWYSVDGAGIWPAANAADEVNDDPGCEAA